MKERMMVSTQNFDVTFNTINQKKKKKKCTFNFENTVHCNSILFHQLSQPNNSLKKNIINLSELNLVLEKSQKISSFNMTVSLKKSQRKRKNLCLSFVI